GGRRSEITSFGRGLGATSQPSFSLSGHTMVANDRRAWLRPARGSQLQLESSSGSTPAMSFGAA
ncbi:hypothetical protein PanWU01x14_266870, partial [Parasponia andersonii]